MLRALAAAAFSALLGIGHAVPAQEMDFDILTLPAQSYTLDPVHSSVIFSVNHLGFSSYTAGFDDISATLVLDPAAPEAAQLTAILQTASLDLPGSPADFLAEMLGETWLNAGAAPEIRFTSTAVTLTGDDTARIDGTLSLRGQEAPLALDARLNGGWAKVPFEPHARLGFSATATLNRADWGMGFGIPGPGSDFGVGGLVELRIEAEFIGPPRS